MPTPGMSLPIARSRLVRDMGLLVRLQFALHVLGAKVTCPQDLRSGAVAPSGVERIGTSEDRTAA
jgi:hypothetical protein